MGKKLRIKVKSNLTKNKSNNPFLNSDFVKNQNNEEKETSDLLVGPSSAGISGQGSRNAP